MSEDFRKQWFCEHILTLLMESDRRLLNASLTLDGGEDYDRLDVFLNADDDFASDDICGRVFTAYKTFYSTTVEEEVVLDEEVQQRPSLFSQLEEKKKDRKGKFKKKSKKVETVETVEREADDDLATIKSRSPMKKKKAQRKGGRMSPYTMMDNLQPDESADNRTISSMTPIKKTIQKVVELSRIQCMHGAIVKDTLKSVDCCVYFIKKKNGRIPLYKDIHEANANMSAHFYVGNLGSNLIEDLELILESVFLPLFQNQILAAEIPMQVENECLTRVEITYKNADKSAATRNRPSSNFINYKCGNNNNKMTLAANRLTLPFKNIDFDFTKELSFLSRTLKRTSTELKEKKELSIYAPNEIDVLLKEIDKSNDEIHKQIANSLNDWAQSLDVLISDNLQNLNHPLKDSSEQNLLAEYFFWEEVEMKLTTVIDILYGELVSTVMEKLKKGTKYTFMCEAIESKKITLHRLQKQVSENTDTLRTHRPFFQTFVSGDFQAITKIIPSYIDSLKSVWMLSKYYGIEKNMQRLLQNTKRTLCDRVKTEFEITALFSCDWDELNAKLEMAKKMLLTWKTSYLNTRHCIESNFEFFIRRWEFDKSTLFSETEYITNVLQDIIDILKAMKQYKNLLELSGLCEIPDCRNECKSLQRKTEYLISPIEKVDFDIYLEIFRDEWLEILDIFQQNMADMDQHLKILIIKTFSQIKAFEESIETVKNISKIETRPTVHDSLPYMCNKIALHFLKQVTTFDQLFEKNKESRPVKVFKICDSTSWAENLLENLIQQMNKLKSMMNTVEISVPVFIEATECYSVLEHKIRNYLSSVLKVWISDVALLMKNTLTDTVIKIERADVIWNNGENEFAVEHSSSSLETKKVTSIMNTLNWIMKSKLTSPMRKNINVSDAEKYTQSRKKRKNSLPKFIPVRLFVEHGCTFKLRLQQEIFDVIEHFCKLNSNCSALPNNTSRMKPLAFMIDSVKINSKKIESLLIKYNKIVFELNSNEIELLKEYLIEIGRAFQPGVLHLTWKWHCIDYYCKQVDIKCEELAFMIRQMKETLGRLNSLVTNIQNINFFPVEKIFSPNLTFYEFIDNTNTIKRENVRKCQQHYEKISQTLIQLESLISCIHGEKSPSMVEYYRQYGGRISRALMESILRSMESLKNLFDGYFAVHFNVHCYLEKNQIKIRPTCERIFESIKITMIEFFTELKCLKFRDPDSTIIKRKSTEDAVVVEKISKNEQIKLVCAAVLSSLQKLCDKMTDSARIWHKYSTIWQCNKDHSVARFASTENPNLNRYETVFNFYSDIENNIDQENRNLSICCVNINAEELMSQLKFHCKEWKTQLSAQLASDTRTIISLLNEKIPKLNRALDTEISGMQDLTRVLTIINEIHDMEIDTNIQLYTIGEHLHELKIQSFMVDEYLIQSFATLKFSWEVLLRTCSYRKFVLEPIAQQASPAIKSQVHKFVNDCRILKEECDEKLLIINSLTFDSRLDWIKMFVKQQSSLDEEQKKLQHMSNYYEVIFPKSVEFMDMSDKLNFIKQEYKVFQYDV